MNRTPAEQDCDKSGLTPKEVGRDCIPIYESTGGLSLRYLKFDYESGLWNEITQPEMTA